VFLYTFATLSKYPFQLFILYNFFLDFFRKRCKRINDLEIF